MSLSEETKIAHRSTVASVNHNHIDYSAAVDTADMGALSGASVKIKWVWRMWSTKKEMGAKADAVTKIESVVVGLQLFAAPMPTNQPSNNVFLLLTSSSS